MSKDCEDNDLKTESRGKDVNKHETPRKPKTQHQPPLSCGEKHHPEKLEKSAHFRGSPDSPRFRQDLNNQLTQSHPSCIAHRES